MALKEDIELIQGKTYNSILRWETDPIVRKAITGSGITWPAGTARIEATGHGLVNGWRCALTGLKSLPINALDPNDIKDKEYHQATVISSDIIEFNDVNASDFKVWTAGGFLQYNTPVNLSNISARMSIKAKLGEYNLLKCVSITTGIAGDTKPEAAGTDGGVVWEETTDVATKEWIAGATYAVNDVIDTKSLLFLTVGNGRIAVDNALKTITRTVSASDIAALTWKKAHYDFEAFTSDAIPVVTLLASGSITVTQEVTK